MRRWWRRNEVQESQGPRVAGSQGPRYLKVTFKCELDSKEGPSCNRTKMTNLMLQGSGLTGVCIAASYEVTSEPGLSVVGMWSQVGPLVNIFV